MPKQTDPFANLYFKPEPKDMGNLLAWAKDTGQYVTSGYSKGGHNAGSKHYQGTADDPMAIDIDHRRIKDYNKFKAEAEAAGFIVRDERVRPAGQKVWGGAHIHLEKGGKPQVSQAKASQPQQAPSFNPSPLPYTTDAEGNIIANQVQAPDIAAELDAYVKANTPKPVAAPQAQPVKRDDSDPFANLYFKPEPAPANKPVAVPATNFLSDLQKGFTNAITGFTRDDLAKAQGGGWGSGIGNIAGSLGFAGLSALGGAGLGSVVPGAGTAGGAIAGLVAGGGAAGALAEDQRQRLAGEQRNILKDLGAGAVGAVSSLPVGGVGSTVAKTILKNAAIDAGINAGGDVALQAIEKGTIDPRQLDVGRTLGQAAIGAGTGGIAGKIEAGKIKAPVADVPVDGYGFKTHQDLAMPENPQQYGFKTQHGSLSSGAAKLRPEQMTAQPRDLAEAFSQRAASQNEIITPERPYSLDLNKPVIEQVSDTGLVVAKEGQTKPQPQSLELPFGYKPPQPETLNVPTSDKAVEQGVPLELKGENSLDSDKIRGMENDLAQTLEDEIKKNTPKISYNDGNYGHVLESGVRVSRNAYDAMTEGRYPLPKARSIISKVLGIPSKDAEKLTILTTGEWHHTSNKANKTQFYDTREALAIYNRDKAGVFNDNFGNINAIPDTKYGEALKWGIDKNLLIANEKGLIKLNARPEPVKAPKLSLKDSQEVAPLIRDLSQVETPEQLADLARVAYDRYHSSPAADAVFKAVDDAEARLTAPKDLGITPEAPKITQAPKPPVSLYDASGRVMGEPPQRVDLAMPSRYKPLGTAKPDLAAPNRHKPLGAATPDMQAPVRDLGSMPETVFDPSVKTTPEGAEVFTHGRPEAAVAQDMAALQSAVKANNGQLVSIAKLEEYVNQYHPEAASYLQDLIRSAKNSEAISFDYAPREAPNEIRTRDNYAPMAFSLEPIKPSTQRSFLRRLLGDDQAVISHLMDQIRAKGGDVHSTSLSFKNGKEKGSAAQITALIQALDDMSEGRYLLSPRVHGVNLGESSRGGLDVTRDRGIRLDTLKRTSLTGRKLTGVDFEGVNTTGYKNDVAGAFKALEELSSHPVHGKTAQRFNQQLLSGKISKTTRNEIAKMIEADVEALQTFCKTMGLS